MCGYEKLPESRGVLAAERHRCGDTAQTFFLFRTRLQIAVAADADENGGFVWLFNPVAVLLEGFMRTLKLHVWAGRC